MVRTSVSGVDGNLWRYPRTSVRQFHCNPSLGSCGSVVLWDNHNSTDSDLAVVGKCSLLLMLFTCPLMNLKSPSWEERSQTINQCVALIYCGHTVQTVVLFHVSPEEPEHRFVSWHTSWKIALMSPITATCCCLKWRRTPSKEGPRVGPGKRWSFGAWPWCWYEQLNTSRCLPLCWRTSWWGRNHDSEVRCSKPGSNLVT